MGIAAILLNGAEPFEQIVNIPLTEGPMWNPVKIGQTVSEKKTFKDFMIIYLYSLGARADNSGECKILILTKKFYIHCKFQPLVLNTYDFSTFP